MPGRSASRVHPLGAIDVSRRCCRGGFCRFTAARYTMDRDDMKNLYVHLTNVAIQKKGDNYDRSVPAPWRPVHPGASPRPARHPRRRGRRAALTAISALAAGAPG